MTPPQTLKLEDTIASLSSLPSQPIRLLIQGAPGEGKTWAALTFPGPIVLDLDNKLQGYKQAHPDTNVMVVNFDHSLCYDKLKCSNGGFNKPNNLAIQPNVRDAIKKWLGMFGPTLDSTRTLVIDSWSSLQDKFDCQTLLTDRAWSKSSGEEDKRVFWGLKQDYSREICDLLKTLKCNIVVTCHEVQEYDDEGRLTGKLKPLMQGGFAPKLAGQFTECYRQICVTKDMKNYPAITKILGREINGDREYLWQTKSNAIFTACLGTPGLKELVPATYESLIKSTAKS